MNDDTRILAGRYEVGELIGRGGMAEVHAGYDTRLGRTVAIKILRADLARDPSFQTRFRREAQAAAGLNHPAIVAVYDTGEEQVPGQDGNPQAVPFIVMEYVEGHTVRDILKGDVAAPIDEAVEITSGVLAALDYAHHAGLVHRDIKPANVMLTPTGAVKVMDFGIARALADAGNTMTQTQAVVGTAQYLSPEQARGETVDARSDLYSTGCLLFELLTGRPPFVGDSPVSVAYQHVREEPPAPSTFASDVPTELDQVVLRSLAKNRDQRYSTAQEFLGDLRAVMGGDPVSPSTGAIAVGSAAFGAGAAGVAAAAMAGNGQPMTPEEIEDQPTQAMPAQPAAPVTGATEVMAASGPSWAAVVGEDQGAQGGPGAIPPPQSASVAVTDEHDLVDDDDRRRKIILWVSLGAALLLAILLLWWLFGRSSEPVEPETTTVAVPNLELMTEAEAEAELTEVGLVPAFTYEASTEVEVDRVISFSPEAGEEVDEGSTVDVVISSGPDAVEVPSVRGYTQDQARLTIEGAGLRVGDVEEVDDKDMEAGRVVETSPAEGESIQPDAEVTLYISSGEVDLPDLVGMDEDAARAELRELGLFANTSDVEDEDTPEGTVLSQSPSAGTVEQGTTVDLDIAVPPSTVEVPNVVGSTASSAEAAIMGAGLQVSYGPDQHSDSVPAGSVISQNPGAGIKVDPATTVELVVSIGPAPQPSSTPTPTPTQSIAP